MALTGTKIEPDSQLSALNFSQYPLQVLYTVTITNMHLINPFTFFDYIKSNEKTETESISTMNQKSTDKLAWSLKGIIRSKINTIQNL